jgi:ABC-type transport system involved in multi-copper enzyme maturation permease subunit
VRKRILMVILLVALLIMLISPAFEPFAAGRGARTLIISFGFGVIQLAGTFIAIIMCTGMIPTEIERRTIYTILSKPVQRYQFVLGKFFGAVGTLGVYVPDDGHRVPDCLADGAGCDFDPQIVRGLLMFFFQSSLLAAVVLFFSTFVSPLVNYFLSGGVFLMGNLLSSFLGDHPAQPRSHPDYPNPRAAAHNHPAQLRQLQCAEPDYQPRAGAHRRDGVSGADDWVRRLSTPTLLLVASMLIFNQREM